MNYTKKQHYLSRYIIKKFANDKEKIDAILVKNMKKIVVDSKDICTEKDFYEDKFKDGEYINRNRTENMFAAMESEVASRLDKLFEILDNENYKKILKSMCNDGRWEEVTVYLMLHLTLVMVRSPKFKDIIFNNKTLPVEIKQIFYKNFLFGKKEGKILVSKYFGDLEKNILTEVIDSGDIDGCINEVLNHLINKYFIEIYKVPVDKKLFLSDDPVIVNEIESIDYFMPLSSRIGIALKRVPEAESYNISIAPMASERMIDNINKIIISNATKVIIVQNMTGKEFKFIQEVLKGEENKKM